MSPKAEATPGLGFPSQRGHIVTGSGFARRGTRSSNNRWTADIRSCAIQSLAPSTSHAKRCLALRIPA